VKGLTETLEVPISGKRVIRVEGLQKDRRRSHELRITLPDGRVILAYGRRTWEGWETFFEGDESSCVTGSPFRGNIALLLGYRRADDGPDWIDRLSDAIA
jgi:hypothetical protein